MEVAHNNIYIDIDTYIYIYIYIYKHMHIYNFFCVYGLFVLDLFFLFFV